MQVKGKRIYMGGESPIHSGVNQVFNDGFFDLTATYRTDADVYMPYGSFFIRGQVPENKYFQLLDWSPSDQDIG